ncbi:MAG: nuclear transport factor 2 family protein [Acidobacteriota bacterium]|nr:nuclear transport factor 2 family protein [Acidobacteriota bacterium]
MIRSILLTILGFAAFGASSRTALAAPLQTNVMSTSPQSLAEFQKVEDAWSNAINTRDQYGLELVLSPLFVDVAATGDISTRNQMVAYLISGHDKSLWLKQKVITVRIIGDAAVINGTYVLHHQTEDGPVDDKGVFTHVFQRLRGRWVCMNSQRTLVREDSTEKGKNGSKSNHAFHLPAVLRRDDKQK